MYESCTVHQHVACEIHHPLLDPHVILRDKLIEKYSTIHASLGHFDRLLTFSNTTSAHNPLESRSCFRRWLCGSRARWRLRNWTFPIFASRCCFPRFSEALVRCCRGKKATEGCTTGSLHLASPRLRCRSSSRLLHVNQRIAKGIQSSSDTKTRRRMQDGTFILVDVENISERNTLKTGWWMNIQSKTRQHSAGIIRSSAALLSSGVSVTVETLAGSGLCTDKGTARRWRCRSVTVEP